MYPEKGKIPAHIKVKEFLHPKAEDPIIVILSSIEDPRQPSCNFRHSLVTILFISLVGLLCGAKNWEEIVQAAQGMSDWIGRYVDISGGIPSVKTCKRVMRILSTKSVDKILQILIAAVQEGIKEGREGDVIAVDGKTLRGSRGWGEETGSLHLLHAWSADQRICLGQVSVSEKSNEITAFPELINSLEIRGAIVTTDALNTQKRSVAAIVSKKADYVLPVKENHKELYEDIKLLFEEADSKAFIGVDGAQSYSLEKKAGRIEERRYDMLDAEELPNVKEWQGCVSVGRVARVRSKGKKRSEEVTFYITSLDMDIEKFAKSARGHWSVENGLHWALDVIFDEDHHRYQDRVGVANLSLLRKVALAMLTNDSSLKCGRAAKQMRAATSASYREHLFKNCF